MLLFLDTEFTDFTERELISIGMVSEDGQHELYLEIQDYNRDKCNSFVRQAVWAELGQIHGAIVKRSELTERLRRWFVTLPRSVKIACDSQHDRELLADALAGEWPKNLTGWLDLRPMIDTTVFHQAVERYHTPDRPWHHALHDAHAHRAGWLAWIDDRKSKR
ncbi:hypothetical protein B0T40_09495 [Chromobacterium haemolyticum]|uniref:3'-5' exoribonuclease n=1 Tax=Chromobacterium haemolyticum TaxID=394935 RepID=UPI0009DB2484|nr:3'-5' exoribonuclease [Chromobacterium haemolyticum]OQS37145.1 hypothetical protein B0T40_09495 [Chromobacterium haemolyticum]